MEAVRGGADLQRECDEEEQQVSSQDTEKKKDGGHHEAADQLTEDGGNAIPVQPVNNCSPPPHNHTHSDTHTDTHSNTHTDTHSNTHSDTHSNTHNHTHNHTDTHSNTDTHNHTHRDNHTHSNTHTDTHSNTHNHTHNNTHSDTDTHTHSDTHSDTHSNTHNHTHNNTHSDTDTHTHSDTDTHTHSDTHRDTHTHTQSLTADDSVKSSGPLSFKVNGLLVSLSGGAAELKLCSHPGGSLSGFTTVQIPVTPRVHKPAETTTSPSAPPAGPAPSAPPAGPAPVITGVVSGGAAQRVVSDHSVHLRSCPWLMGKKTPCTMPTSSRKKQDTPAASHRLLEEGQQHVPPPDCPVCRSQYHFITELRGFMCLCSTAIALSLKLLKKKKRRGRSQHRRTRMFKSPRDPQISRPPGAKTQPGTPAVIHQLADDITSPTPLTSNCSPSQQDPREPPLDPHHGKLVILVDDFYYGSAPGRPRSNNVTHAGNKGPYTCIHCQSTLHNNIDLMSHLKLHMQTFEMHACRCPHCYRYFTSSFRLQCHLEAVHSQCESTAKCKICERAFGSEAAFLLHMKSRHKPGEMPYACQVCDFRSSFHSDLWSHFELSHKDTKYLLCPFCVRVISTSAFYQQHISRHQRKYVFGCDQCRLHFLYVKERIQHKQIHHRTHIKPAQLTGLKPGTKVTVRMYSLTRRSETEEGLKKSSPFKVVDVGSLPPRQEAPQRKLVESLGGLLSTLSQESMSADVSRPASLCVECLSSVQDFSSHFPSLVRCSLCSFVTCCCTAYANHMIK